MSSVRPKKKLKTYKQAVNGNGCLSDSVRTVMDKYFTDLDGHKPADLYELIISQVEAPLFETVLRHTRGNVSMAAEVLGLNRGTLRNRLRKYELE